MAAERPSDVVLWWNEVALDAIRAGQTAPPLAARNLAIMHAALYDALNSIEGTYSPYYYYERVPDASPVAAASVAAGRTLAALFPGQGRVFDVELDRALQNVPPGAARTLGIWLGEQAADKMLKWRERDGATSQAAYRPPSGRGFWSPTPPDYLPALLPRWGASRCFCLRSGDQFRPAAPPSMDSASYARDFKEVKELGALSSSVRTPEQTEIALFWADVAGTVTPPGHWNQIAQAVAGSRRTTTMENARLFALLNLALADAAIACWDSKFSYSYWRPIQGIRAARQEGSALGDDPGWTPLIITPPFPSYTSGHSTFSGAGAAVLARFFGTDRIPFTVGSAGGVRGLPRSFSSFSAAAQEAGRSRIYGGIHWEFDNVAGLALGRSVGEYVARTLLVPVQTQVARQQ
jgi:hypothetical protein